MAEFRPDRDVPMKEDDPDADLFLRWYYYDWLPEEGEQPAEAFLRSKDPRVDPDVFTLVDKTIDAPYSFLQVTGVRPGESFDARDILRKREFSIIERGATQTLQQMMDKHRATWPDTPVPALRGMTPRRAAKDPAGRELLESLLLDFESRNRQAPGGFEQVDVANLRKDLGMERR
jgi:hypothetical protein